MKMKIKIVILLTHEDLFILACVPLYFLASSYTYIYVYTCKNMNMMISLVSADIFVISFHPISIFIFISICVG